MRRLVQEDVLFVYCSKGWKSGRTVREAGTNNMFVRDYCSIWEASKRECYFDVFVFDDNTVVQEPSLRRRKRVEDLIKETEIGEAEIEIARDIVIGSGGSSTVFLANYDGVNAACKVPVDAF